MTMPSGALFRNVMICMMVSCLFPVLVGTSTQTVKTYKISFLPSLSQLQYKHHVGAFVCAFQQFFQDRVWEHQGEKIRFEYMFNKTKGDVHQALQIMTDHLNAGSVAFIGPEDSCAHEAMVAAAWNVPMISFKCIDSAVSDRQKYPTFARTIPSASKVSKSLISMMKYFQWKSFTLIHGNSTKWLEAAETLKQLAERYKIRLTDKRTFNDSYVHGTKMEPILEDTYKNTRIYVFLGDDLDAVVDFARAMYRKGINKKGDYVIIAVQDKPYEYDRRYKYMLNFLEEDIPSWVVEAFRPVLLLLHRAPDNPGYEDFLDASRKYSTQPPFNMPMSPLLKVKIRVPQLEAAYLYDAVRLYAEALNRSFASNESIRNGTAVIAQIREFNYKSILGYRMHIDSNGDAEANYTVVALREDTGNDSKFGRSMQPVGRFEALKGTSNDNDNIPIFTCKDCSETIDWISGRIPSSEPACGFDGSLCQPDWTTAVVCTIAACAILVLVVVAGRHYIYEQRLASLLWKLDFKDLVIGGADIDPMVGDKAKVDLKLQRKTHHQGRTSYNSGSGESGQPLILGRQQAGIRVASYKGTLVAVRMLSRRHVEITRAVRKELHMLKEISHDNVNRFLGACVEPPNICIVTQYSSRGSLKDILENDDLHLDDMFIASLVFDLIKGMIYLHDSEISSHGNLKSSNCLVDSRWVLQISDFGLYHLKATEVPHITHEDSYYARLLWKAPELLRDPYAAPHGTQKGDVYAFAIIMYEIHGRAGPWGHTLLPPREIVEKVKQIAYPYAPFRPDMSILKCEDFIIKCIQDCWHESPDSRPDFKYIRIRLKPMQRGLILDSGESNLMDISWKIKGTEVNAWKKRRANIFDNMLAIMERYADNLEALVAERTEQLLEEKKKTDALLFRMLPRSVAEQLKAFGKVQPEQYESVTIYFSDIVGFTSISAESTPMQVVDMLNDLYTTFDSIIEAYDVYKVETIGDAYMVVSGLPIRNVDNHAGEIASMSLHLLDTIQNYKIKHRPDDGLNLRIGIHSGPCVAGVVGLKMPRYCLFGDTVNTASRLETTGIPLKIHCSPQAKELLDKLGGYKLEERGPVNMKGKGTMITYFLLGEDKMERLRRISVGKNDAVTTPETKRSLRKFKELSNGRDSMLSLKSLWAPSNSVESDVTISLENVVTLNGSVRYTSDGSVEFDV